MTSTTMAHAKQNPRVNNATQVARPQASRLGVGMGADMMSLQRSAGNSSVNALINSLGGGSPLPMQLRGEMEQRFGEDFSKVRMHTDAQAAQSADDLNAKAYTVGNNIVFNQDRFNPTVTEGKQLIAHELAHVIQQSRGGTTPTFKSNSPNEHSASKAAISFTTGSGQIAVDGAAFTGIAREEDEIKPSKKKPRKKNTTKAAPLGKIPIKEEQTKRLNNQLEENLLTREDTTSITTESWQKQGREDKQGVLRLLSQEKGNPKKIPEAVRADLEEQFKKYYKVMDNGTYDEKKHTVSLPKGYVLGHYEGEYGDPLAPARDGYDYNNTRVITKVENDLEEARRKEKVKIEKAQTVNKKNQDKPKAVPPIIRKKQSTSRESTTPPKETVKPAINNFPKDKRGDDSNKHSNSGASSNLANPNLKSKLTNSIQEPNETPEMKVISKGNPKGIPTIPTNEKILNSTRKIVPLTSDTLVEAQTLRAQNTGAILGAGVGLLTGFALNKYREWMVESLAAIPPIEKDSMLLNEYFKNSSSTINILGLMTKDIDGFAIRVEESSQRVLNSSAGEILLLVGESSKNPAERIEKIRQLDAELSSLQSDLFKARQGIDAALELEPIGQDRIAAATDLAEFVLDKKPGMRNVIVWNWLVEQGFSIDEIMLLHENLLHYASMIKLLFHNLQELKARTDKVYEEVSTFSSKLNSIYWAEVFQHARPAKTGNKSK